MVIFAFVPHSALDQLLVVLLPALEAFARHPLRRADRGDGVGRVGQVERAVLGAEEAAGGERLQLLRLADAFEPLSDIDERRNRGMVRASG